MRNSRISSIITQNRLISRAKSRARTQSTNIGKVLQNSSNNKNNTLSAIKNAANTNKYGGLTKEDAESKDNYTTMKKAAESLKTHTEKLLSMPDQEWEKLTEEEISGYKEKAVSEITSMIEDYNQMIKSMAAEGGSVNKTYLEQMKDYFQNAKKDLNELGIGQKSDGTLTVSQEILKEADAKRLKEVFSSQGTFVSRVNTRVDNVISNAETNLAVLNRSQYAGNYSYNQYGSDIFDLLTSGGKYNAKG